MQRCWTTPIREDRYVQLAPGIALQGIIEVTGHWNCFDVYCSCPTAAWRDVRVQARTMTGSAIAVVGDTVLQRVTGQFTPGGEAAAFSALVFSIRGRTCERFNVQAFAPEEALSTALWWVHAWGEGDVYGDLASRLPVELFATGARRRTSLVALTADVATTVLFTSNADGGQTAITHLGLSSDDTTSHRVELSYQVGLAPAVVVAAWHVVAGAPILVDFTYPLRSERGAVWSVTATTVPGLGESIIVEAVGFDE